ncbi:MAG: DUF4954 family protein, partial [Bacteroidaceae bacterium]|nr:DUF4954 family protein [Bacteroidaceae bacterium]
GFQCHSGLSHVALFNVTVEDDCCIQQVQNYIANYHIGEGTLIQNVGLLAVEGPTSFGNGTEVSVLNETGGREVMIHDSLSAQQAYMMALYRHRPELVHRLQQMTQGYVEQVTGHEGRIGRDCQLINTQFIRNVKIGDSCQIIGACRLSNGSLNSCKEAPVYIGQGCIFQDFIVSSGSKLADGVMLERVFVGQACKLGHGYMASDSLFFSNCQGENGEACAIFAGPFTVTHHKSSLLIAGMYSFMNAGSGSNQSNHMYKLGPIHQGIMERGSKTASDSYVLWPSRVGAFSLVMGRHVTHSDTTNLPFSYLIEKQNTTYLVPGVNLRSVGTIRDAQKWPKRDGRTDSNRLDCINYNLLSPFTIQKMLKGVETLNNLRYASGELSDIYSFHSTKIKNSSLKKGIQFYNTAIHKFMGNSIISRLEKVGEIKTEAQLRERLRPDTAIGEGEWIDMAGLIAPKSEVLRLMAEVEEGRVTQLAEVNERFREMHENYYDYEWTWAYRKIASVYGIEVDKITAADVIHMVEQWKEAVVGLDRLVYEDARKEFSLASMTGFGADGNRNQKEMDFEQVRGDFESNGFVNAVLKHIEVKSQLGDRTIQKLKEISK